MHRLASLMIVAVTVASLAGCSSCQRLLGHGHAPAGAPCGPQPCGPQPYPAMAPAYPAPYAAGAPMVTDPNMIMPAPH